MNPEDFLGYRFRDLVYGVEGVCVAYTTHLTGCDSITLGRLNEKGEPDGWNFDITAVQKMGDEKVTLREVFPPPPPGGPPTRVRWGR